MKRLYDARPSNIRPFMDRMKLHISELDLPNVHIQQRNLFLFQPWSTPLLHYISPFATYSKSTVAPVVFQRVFAYHRSQYSRYSAIYTDGSKRADYVGCGVVIEDIMHSYRLDTSCSIFTAEAVAIYRALQLIDSTMPRKYCIYTDSMSVLEALENYNNRCHPVESWSQQLDNKLHSVKPVIGAWPVMPMRRTDVKLIRLRIGHTTRLTHRHLLFGEHAPECPSCNVSYTVHHILIDCPVFNHRRITFFNSSHLTLPDLPKLALAPITPKLTHSLRILRTVLNVRGSDIRKLLASDNPLGGSASSGEYGFHAPEVPSPQGLTFFRVFTIGMMTQRTAPWENWHLERGFELLRTFGLVRWALGGSGHVEGTGEKLSFASQAAR
ncbi:RNase H domain-containing protein [Trichonephila clavipes]|nr:RNase H domain-containing protein [Trichonephila clavipes]